MAIFNKYSNGFSPLHIYKDHGLKIDFQNENYKKVLV